MKNRKNIIQQKREVLIVFDEKIANMESIKKLSLIVTELLLRGRKLNISLGFISQSRYKHYTKEPYSFLVKDTTAVI